MNKKYNRTSERYLMHVPVTVNNLDKNEIFTSRETVNISSGGVLIESRGLNLSTGSKVLVELTLTVDKLKELFQVSNKVLLKINGEVTRRTEQEIAVKFSNSYSIYSLNNSDI